MPVILKESSLAGIVSASEIYRARDELAKQKDPFTIVAQAGGQSETLACQADIVITGGSRGGGKSMSLLLSAMPYIYEDGFRGILLRHEKDDLSDIIDTSKDVYREFGDYIISESRWKYNNGGYLQFSYHGGSFDDFRTRFQGRQYSLILVDEVTQMTFDKFKYLVTCNRNAYHLRNRFVASCNPDPNSFVAKFIDWWIGEDGFPNPERVNRIRYCFFDGDSVEQIVWGDTREEVYLQCKSSIDKIWNADYERYGKPEELFIKSVAFCPSKLSDNIALMSGDPTYLANLAMQSEEQRARDLEGNWKYKTSGDDMIKLEDIERFFENTEQVGDGKLYASCDAAFDGGDNLVLILWEGMHIKDIATLRKDSRATMNFLAAKLEEWGVREENFTFDKQGLGLSIVGFFPKAKPFNNRAAVDEKYKNIYAGLKSQCAYMLVQYICDGKISIEPRLLNRKFSGKGFENATLRQILLKERKALRPDVDNTAEKGFCLIKKPVMKRIVGHSPDFVEAMLMRMIFEVGKNKHTKRRALTSYTSGLSDDFDW